MNARRPRYVPPRLDAIDLNAIRARVNAATPGPWVAERTDCGNFWFDAMPKHSTPIESRGTQFMLGVAVGAAAEQHDAEFISHARGDIPMLLARAEAFEEYWLDSQEELHDLKERLALALAKIPDGETRKLLLAALEGREARGAIDRAEAAERQLAT